MKRYFFCCVTIILIQLLNFAPTASPQTLPSCPPGWNGQVIIDGESSTNWSVEADNGSSGTVTTVGGFIGGAVQLNWNIGSGQWVQAKYTFPAPIDLSQKDIFGLSLRGSTGVTNRVSLMFADVNGVFFGMDCDGLNTISVWMKNLPLPKKLFYHFFTIGPNPNRKEIDWSRIDRFFVVVKRPQPGAGGGAGQIAIDHLQADRAMDWQRQQDFAKVNAPAAAKANAVRYLLGQQKSTGLLVSWQEESPPRAYLYDQALALMVLTREGSWQAGTPINEAAQKAKKLVDFITSKQKTLDGHWPRAWNPETGQELADDGWVGDQAWWVMALMEYTRKSSDAAAHVSAESGANWLTTKIDPATGKVVPSTEGTVDVWWAMIATQRFALADKMQNYLLTQVWDNELKYWWRGRSDNPDPVVAMDCATWVGEFAKTKRVNRPEMALQALSFVRRTLLTTDVGGARCGFDGMGPVSIWCEGTAQYVSAGGEDAQKFLDLLLSLQNQETGGMPGSPDSLAGSCFGWLSKWTGLSSTAWLYFALTRPPFPTELATAVAGRAIIVPNQFVLQQNFPNPFSASGTFGNAATKIAFVLPQASEVKLEVFSLVGERVATLANGRFAAGDHAVSFAAENLPSGVYVYRLKTEKFEQQRKLLMLK